MRLKIRNLPWLIALGALIGIVVFTGTATGAAALLLLGLYAAAFALSSIRLNLTLDPARLIEAPRQSLAAARTSPDARQAAERARRRGGVHTDVILADIGLIATQSGREGITMRRARDASADDDGIRPYITLKVPPKEADRSVRVRFEMLDQRGEVRYVHEMRTFLRDGEISVLADHHLPLAGSAPGDWDLRVSVDGLLLGLYAFQVIPSTRDRLAYLGGNDRAFERPASAPRADDRGRRLTTPDDSIPMSLEDLLRQQGTNGSQSSNGTARRGDRAP
ncbi:MAG: hypothetical protein SGJ24_06260 [Chloroflexota bacterium]|nr:hypothetical protein [Chloroflexota bacterium]